MIKIYNYNLIKKQLLIKAAIKVKNCKESVSGFAFI